MKLRSNIDRQTDKQIVRQLDKQTVRQLDKQSNRQTDRLLSEQSIILFAYLFIYVNKTNVCFFCFIKIKKSGDFNIWSY